MVSIGDPGYHRAMETRGITVLWYMVQGCGTWYMDVVYGTWLWYIVHGCGTCYMAVVHGR